jgi:sec-independent protein translocase protein TatB
MFDFAWSELALIAVVAMIFIGPKDMPVAIRAVTGWIKKARRMAAEFQTHVDEMVREADLSEVRASINEIRNFNIRGEIEKTIDADGSIRAAFASNPLAPSSQPATPAEESAVTESVVETLETDARIDGSLPQEEPAVSAPADGPLAPAFVPPKFVQAAAQETAGPEPPAFIPPGVVPQHRARSSA